MKWVSRFLMSMGLILLIIAGYSIYDHARSSSVTLEEAQSALAQDRNQVQAANEEEFNINEYQAAQGEPFGVLTIPRLERSIAIVEGSDADSLKKGVGHVASTVFPGQGEQIVLSGHRDTVFRDFGALQIGDTFEVEMSYGNFEYQIRDYEIVDRFDTSVIRNMGEEVLVVTTCYPFDYFGYAPERFVFYAYPM